MADQLSGYELLQIKRLMARILRQYYNTDDIVTKSELEDKYNKLQEKVLQYHDIVLNDTEVVELAKLNLYTELYEEYNTSNNIVRKSEIEEWFMNLDS